MKNLWLIAMMAVALTASASDFYRLTGVTRIDQDLYKTSDGIYIKTRFCYEYVYGEDAILRDGGPYDMTIIFENDSTCDVEAIWNN